MQALYQATKQDERSDLGSKVLESLRGYAFLIAEELGMSVLKQSDAANRLRMLQTRAVPRRLLVKPIPYIGRFMALDLPHCVHNI